MKPWYENERFWKLLRPFLFPAERWECAPAEAAMMADLLGIEAPARVLDLCCGPGRHAMALATLGFAVTGIDSTRSYLAEARRLARQQGLHVDFVLEDARSFVREEAFDAVINAYTSFGYFEGAADDRRLLDNAYRSLCDGGQILLELKGRELVARDFTEKDWQETPEGAFLLEQRRVARDWSHIENRWIVVDGQTRVELEFGHRMYAGTELRALVEAVGFRDVRVFGSLEGVPYDDDAEMLVVAGRK